MNNELIKAYGEMAKLTEPLCGQCRVPHSCCGSEYCALALETAAEDGVILQQTTHPTLPLMGEKGCTCPPHYRQVCTMHVCSMNGLGFLLHADRTPDLPLTKKYFQIRNKIERMERPSHGKTDR